MITTDVGRGHFYVTTQDPFSKWSDPHWLPTIGGIDPSFFFDDDGKAYIVHKEDTEGKPKWSNFRSIRITRFDTTTGDPQEPYTRMSVRLQYIDIPVHLKYYPYEGLNFHIGPRIGFLVDSKAKAAGMQWNADDALHTVDLGLDFGAGYELKCGFLVYAQYSVGLTDIMKQSGVKSHNDGFNIGVGWRF